MAGPTKQFTKAIEKYRQLVLQQQELQKKFVAAEKYPAKREALKKELIALHKKVKDAEQDFNTALMREPIDDLEEVVDNDTKQFVKEHAFRALVRKKINEMKNAGTFKLINKKTIKEAIKLIKESINEQKKKINKRTGKPVGDSSYASLLKNANVGDIVTYKGTPHKLVKIGSGFDSKRGSFHKLWLKKVNSDENPFYVSFYPDKSKPTLVKGKTYTVKK